MILVDANIFMYAAGAPHPNKAPSVAFLHEAARMTYDCCINAEILQEILHRYRSIERWQDGQEIFSLARKIVPTVEPVTVEIMEEALRLMNRYRGLMARDCVHAAHCVVHGLDGICSFDTDFDTVSEIRRIVPTE